MERHSEHFCKTKIPPFQYHEFRNVELSLSVQYPKEFTVMLCDLLSQFKTIHPISECSDFYLPPTRTLCLENQNNDSTILDLLFCF